jgi:hypothetical protein
MKTFPKMLITTSAALWICGAAAAGEPVAIVEAVTPPHPAVAAMDLVEPGRTIDMGAGGELVLGYLRSCQRERIRGGAVTVGAERSTVTGGRIVRERVECDGGKLVLTPEQAARSGALVFRRPPAPAD